MTDARTLLQSALEFAEFCWREVPLNDYAEEKREALEQSIRAHLAAEQQEPVAAGVAWVMGDDGQKTLGPKCCDKTVAVRCPGYPHDAPPAAPAPEIESLVRDIHKAVKRGEDTRDHGLIGNLRCILDHVLTDPPDMTAPAPVVPLTEAPVKKLIGDQAAQGTSSATTATTAGSHATNGASSYRDTAVVPLGYVLVPVEPTPNMNSHGVLALYRASSGDIDSIGREIAEAYRAMLAAAPKVSP